MLLPTDQDRELQALTARAAIEGGSAVGQPFPDGTLAVRFTPTDTEAPEVAELLDPQGLALPPAEVIRRLGETRRRALELADAATDHLIATLAIRVNAGEPVNLSAIHRETDVARQTLYNRLQVLGIDPANPPETKPERDVEKPASPRPDTKPEKGDESTVKPRPEETKRGRKSGRRQRRPRAKA